MTSLVLLLLHVLLMPSSVWSDNYWYYGGAQTVTPKEAGGTYEVELRNKQATYSCHVNPYRCAYGNCGATIQSASTVTTYGSYGIRCCQMETKTRLRLNSTLPFEIRIDQLLVTGPSGISSRMITTGEYVIRWTPTDNDLNNHFPVCFLAEALDGYRLVYHSELRCVTVDVRHYDIIVTCKETTMMVEVKKTDLLRRYEDRLHLLSSDTKCSLKTLSNSTHLVAVVSLASCGTYVQEDQDNIFYENKITSAEPNKTISRKADVEIAFSCAFPKKNHLTLRFKHKNPYAFKERGFGSFSFQFEFFQSQLFRQKVDASTYPVEVNLNQMMFMQIKATSSMPDVELFVESCKASPGNSRISYSIIENGCVKDSTVQIYPSSKSQFRFGMAAFEFIGANNEVYITCSVLLCESDVPNTRCSQGCIQPGSHRRSREAANQTSRHFISQGPLRLARS
ncbi:CUB and zona pellucida-like domain-containing protein 1 [Gouania willdenowi]|uniref:CUB and zona pellucida-like domain-containing protein 1 n=1 Tax=Gouania willdenowi TaxID=441366 RepID=UPI001054CBA3|nr:CUB and zona pellucida-like domain-containing protein 1 [Gouania willdenowi]